MTTRAKLIADILRGQENSDGSFTDDRIRAALAGKPPLSVDERLLLWSSPDARAHFLSVRREFRRELTERFRSEDLGYLERALAAAGGEDDAEKFQGNGFSVMIFHDNLPGEEWSISCQLDPAYSDILPPRTVVTLRDTGDLVWASGVPDDQGRFGGVWTYRGETPVQRLKRNALWLDP